MAVEFYDPNALAPVIHEDQGGISHLLIDAEDSRLYMVNPERRTLIVGRLADRKVVSEIDVGDDARYWRSWERGRCGVAAASSVVLACWLVAAAAPAFAGRHLRQHAEGRGLHVQLGDDDHHGRVGRGRDDRVARTSIRG